MHFVQVGSLNIQVDLLTQIRQEVCKNSYMVIFLCILIDLNKM